MDWLKATENRKTVEELSKVGLCLSCQFRALTGNYEGFYKGTPVTELVPMEMSAEQSGNSGEARISGQIDNDEMNTKCSVCLGILAESRKIAAAVLEALRDKGYDPSNYKISITIPNEIYVREKVI